MLHWNPPGVRYVVVHVPEKEHRAAAHLPTRTMSYKFVAVVIFGDEVRQNNTNDKQLEAMTTAAVEAWDHNPLGYLSGIRTRRRGSSKEADVRQNSTVDVARAREPISDSLKSKRDRRPETVRPFTSHVLHTHRAVGSSRL